MPNANGTNGAAAATNVWSLQAPKLGLPESTESFFSLVYKGQGEETAFIDDSRDRVPLSDLDVKGKYRSIIKLFCRYEGQKSTDKRQAIGTGWLIRPDLLVTAGHCVFDWNHNFGKVVEIKAYLGYHGKDAADKSDGVQFRRGVKVTTSPGWLKSKVNRQNDLGLVQLDKAFTGVVPFEWIDTPLKATMQIGVVGYPGDKQKEGADERGAEMYEMWAPVTFNRELAKNKMLDYPISSGAGQSGSPVLAKTKDGIRAIGIHTYGGTENNSATPFGTDKTFGNRLQDYINLVDNQKGDKPTPSPAPKPKPGPVIRPVNPEDHPDAESAFWDVLKTVGKAALPIAKGVLSIAPIVGLGPVGAVLAPLAGIALDAAGKLVTESSIDDGTTDSVASEIENSGSVHRAILAEAALTAVLAIPEDTLKDTTILDDMKAHFVQNHFAVKTVAPAIRNAVLEPGFRVALDVSREQTAELERLKKGGKPKLPSKKLPLPGAEAYLSGQESDFDGADFVKAMVEDDTTVVPGAEGWFGSIVSAISSGVQAAAPVVGGLVLDLVKSSLAESSFDDAPSSTGTTKAFDTLAQRALMGEAALQALMKQDVNFLKEEHLTDKHTGEPESIFGFMKSVIQTIGPRVLSALPHVIKAVGPLVEGFVKKNAESGFPVAMPSQPLRRLPKKSNGSGSLMPPGRTIVRKKSKSLLDSLTDEQATGKNDTPQSGLLGGGEVAEPRPDVGWVSE